MSSSSIIVSGRKSVANSFVVHLCFELDILFSLIKLNEEYEMHISPKSITQYPWLIRLFFRSQEKEKGLILLPGLLWARISWLHILFVFFWKQLDRKSSPLDADLRALVQVRVAQLNWCSFCTDYNSLNLLTRTNSLEKVDLLEQWETHAIFTDVERIVLEYVGIVSGPQVKVSNELMNKLKTHLSDDQIVKLTALIAFQNMSAKFNAALDIPSQGLCKIPGTNMQSK